MIKKLLYLLILIFFTCGKAFAVTQDVRLEYNVYGYRFSPGEEKFLLVQAEKNMDAWENSILMINRQYYLKEAMRYYFLLSQADNTSIDAQIGLGRIYDEMNLNKQAKEHFFLAYNMDSLNPKLNLYFGNYYYKRKQLITALYHYKRAYEDGYAKDYCLNCRIGNLYEKLADINSAKEFYVSALKLNPGDIELTKKIRLLDELNYSKSQYYKFGK